MCVHRSEVTNQLARSELNTCKAQLAAEEYIRGSKYKMASLGIRIGYNSYLPKCRKAFKNQHNWIIVVYTKLKFPLDYDYMLTLGDKEIGILG